MPDFRVYCGPPDYLIGYGPDDEFVVAAKTLSPIRAEQIARLLGQRTAENVVYAWLNMMTANWRDVKDIDVDGAANDAFADMPFLQTRGVTSEVVKNWIRTWLKEQHHEV
jgi:hypothetical protein